MLLGAPHIATRSKDATTGAPGIATTGAPGIATRSKDAPGFTPLKTFRCKQWNVSRFCESVVKCETRRMVAT